MFEAKPLNVLSLSMFSLPNCVKTCQPLPMLHLNSGLMKQTFNAVKGHTLCALSLDKVIHLIWPLVCNVFEDSSSKET